jgi:hypothetical protein
MISGQRPGEEQNGLDEIADELLAPNSEDVVVVAVMRVTKIVDAVEKGDRYPVVRIARRSSCRRRTHSARVTRRSTSATSTTRKKRPSDG